jgi:hypothetical protein
MNGFTELNAPRKHAAPREYPHATVYTSPSASLPAPRYSGSIPRPSKPRTEAGSANTSGTSGANSTSV